MELVSIENSQLIALFIAANPAGRPSVSYAVRLLVERYGFVGFPTKIDDLGGDSVGFREGAFQGKAIEIFNVHRDGIVVSAKAPTSLLDEFLDDLRKWMKAELGLESVDTHGVDKNYESHIVVRTNAPILRALDALAPIQEAMARSLKSATKLDVVFHGAALALGPDHSLIAGMKPIPFRLERRAGLSFETGLYYSAAPLPTAEHIKVLERMERLA